MGKIVFLVVYLIVAIGACVLVWRLYKKDGREFEEMLKTLGWDMSTLRENTDNIRSLRISKADVGLFIGVILGTTAMVLFIWNAFYFLFAVFVVVLIMFIFFVMICVIKLASVCRKNRKKLWDENRPEPVIIPEIIEIDEEDRADMAFVYADGHESFYRTVQDGDVVGLKIEHLVLDLCVENGQAYCCQHMYGAVEKSILLQRRIPTIQTGEAELIAKYWLRLNKYLDRLGFDEIPLCFFWALDHGANDEYVEECENYLNYHEREAYREMKLCLNHVGMCCGKTHGHVVEHDDCGMLLLLRKK